MTPEVRNRYGVPVLNDAVTKCVPLCLKEATAIRQACMKVLLQTPPSEVWDDLHKGYMSVCITFGLPTRIKPTGGDL